MILYKKELINYNCARLRINANNISQTDIYDLTKVKIK
jgi:hypothetical protein